jgi:alkylhydroperoxidase family enzyme
MARLPYLEAADLAPADRDLLIQRPIALYKALVHSPNAARALIGLADYVRHGSKLDPRLRELAILQVGWLARAAYEWAHHIKIAYDFGASEADIQGLIDDNTGKPSGLEPLARQVLQAAREITVDGAMSEHSFRSLQAALGNECLVDLSLAVALYNAVVRLLGTLQIDLEDDFLPYLRKFPLP